MLHPTIIKLYEASVTYARKQPLRALFFVTLTMFIVIDIVSLSSSSPDTKQLRESPKYSVKPEKSSVATTATSTKRTDVPATDSAARDIHVQVTPKVSAVIGAPMAGRLVEFPLHDGDRFAKDQLLSRFDCDVQEGTRSRAQALLEGKKRLFEAQSRLKELGTASGIEYDVASAQFHEAEAEVATTQAVVEKCKVKAPFAGRVSGVNVHANQFVTEGAPLLEILSDQDLELEFMVPSTWLIWVKPGTSFDVSITETGKTYHAEITELSGKVDAVSQSIHVYGRLIGPAAEILPGMSGRALLAPPAQH